MAAIETMSTDTIWQEIEVKLNDNPAPISGLTTTYQINLSGDDGGTYTLKVVDGVATTSVGEAEVADCTLSMSVKDFKKLLLGKLNATGSFMMGKLKVDGSLGLALKLESLLKKYSFE